MSVVSSIPHEISICIINNFFLSLGVFSLRFVLLCKHLTQGFSLYSSLIVCKFLHLISFRNCVCSRSNWNSLTISEDIYDIAITASSTLNIEGSYIKLFHTIYCQNLTLCRETAGFPLKLFSVSINNSLTLYSDWQWVYFGLLYNSYCVHI